MSEVRVTKAFLLPNGSVVKVGSGIPPTLTKPIRDLYVRHSGRVYESKKPDKDKSDKPKKDDNSGYTSRADG